MFNGDNFLNFCQVWEKAISLMMKIARLFSEHLAIYIPFITVPFFVVIMGFFTQKEENDISIMSDYWNSCNRSSACRSYEIGPSSEPQCMFRQKLYLIICLTQTVILFSHLVVVNIYYHEEKKLGFAIIRLMFNFILIPLIGLQVYVSYIPKVLFICRCSKNWQKKVCSIIC